MPISQQWVGELKRTILLTYDAVWTWDELQQLNHTTVALMNSVDHPVAVIHDVHEVAKLPPGNIIVQARIVLDGYPENLSQIIAVVNTPIVNGLLTILIGVYPKWRGVLKAVNTLEKAYIMAEKTHSSV